MKAQIRLSYTRVFLIAVALSLLAKFVGPQSGQASTQNNTSDLVDALVEVRGTLDLYKAQHNGNLPPAHSFSMFRMALTRQIRGYGPYMVDIPTNPFNGLDTVRFDGLPPGANLAGWRFDTNTGIFQADNDAAHAAL